MIRVTLGSNTHKLRLWVRRLFRANGCALAFLIAIVSQGCSDSSIEAPATQQCFMEVSRSVGWEGEETARAAGGEGVISFSGTHFSTSYCDSLWLEIDQTGTGLSLLIDGVFQTNVRVCPNTGAAMHYAGTIQDVA